MAFYKLSDELLSLKPASQQLKNLPADIVGQHGIDADATIALPRGRRTISREDTIVFDAMDTM